MADRLAMDPTADVESFDTTNWGQSTLQCYKDHKEFCENVRRDTGGHALAMSLIFRQVSLHRQVEMLRQHMEDHSAALKRLAQDLVKVHGKIVDNHLVLMRVSGYPEGTPAPATSSSTAKGTD